MKTKLFLTFCAALLIAVFSLFSLVACNSGSSNSSGLPSNNPGEIETPDNPDNSGSNDTSDTPSEKKGNILIVYFTWSNNTERMANYIYGQTGGTIREIVPVTPYPTTSYTEWGYSARDERDADARPPIANPLSAETVAQYDTILIGFPIWWHTAPMIIGTFLESYEWSADVDIYPFFQGASNSNAEYYDNSMAFVRRCAKGATVHEGLYTASSNTSRINEYLSQNGLIK